MFFVLEKAFSGRIITSTLQISSPAVWPAFTNAGSISFALLFWLDGVGDAGLLAANVFSTQTVNRTNVTANARTTFRGSLKNFTFIFFIVVMRTFKKQYYFIYSIFNYANYTLYRWSGNKRV